MKAVLQRVAEARVVIAGETVGQIGAGLLVLLCAERGDAEAQADKLLAKILKLRIFSDEAGKMKTPEAACSSSASSRWRPTCRAATGPASPAPPPPTKGVGFTITSWRRRDWFTRWFRPDSLLPTCRYTWSMTAQ